MEQYSIKFIEHSTFLEAEATGILLSVEDLMQSSFKIFEQLEKTQKNVVFMSKNQLVISITPKEVEVVLNRVEQEIPEALNVYCIALESDVGKEEQQLFEQLCKGSGIDYELFKSREDALNRISELTLVGDE